MMNDNEFEGMNNQLAEHISNAFNNLLKEKNLKLKIISYDIGPIFTRYNIQSEDGVSIKSIRKIVTSTMEEIGFSNTRFVPSIESTSMCGIEVPNAKKAYISFNDAFDKLPSPCEHPLAIPLGVDVNNDFIHVNLNELPHILISGSTGSGKSTFIHSLIHSLMRRNSSNDLKFVLVDLKKTEFNSYKDNPYLYCDVIDNANDAYLMFDKLVKDMETRYELFEKSSWNANNIEEYNSKFEKDEKLRLPYIIVIIDEFADLACLCRDIDIPITTLSQKARAAGIHIVLASQVTNSRIISRILKANLPAHIAFKLYKITDSVNVIDNPDATKLLGSGDMLVKCPILNHSNPLRLQSCYMD